jgi:tetratricopeptide (TPR) repeat protein
VIASLVFVMSLASSAAAQDPSEARVHFEQGVAHFEAGRYEEALSQFRDAYRIRPHPSVLVNLANCYANLGRPVEAAQHFERYLRDARGAIDPATSAEVQRALGAARASIGTLEIYGAAGISVRVDGNDLGQTPLTRPVEVNPGMHTVEFRGPSGRVFTDRIEVSEGGSATAEAPIDASAPPERARRPPPRTGEVAEGLSEQDDSDAAEPEAIDVDDGGSGGFPIPVATLVAGGLGLVAIGVGTAFGVVALGQKSDYDDVLLQIRTTRDERERQNLALDAEDIDDARASNALLADVFFGVGIAALVTGAVIWIVDATGEDAPAVAFAPLPGGAAGSLRLAF